MADDKFDGGGFATGTHGRGPTPYKKSHSRKPASPGAHMGTAGRGGPGRLGGGDQVKGNREDLSHPETHAAFEGLGADGDGE